MSATGSWDPAGFRNLDSNNSTITSDATRKYNCFAWAAGDSHRRWEPDAQNNYYWPKGVPRELTIEAFVRAYETLGYVECPDASVERGFQKVAIYTKRYYEGTRPTHAALQLPDGRWTSKLGDAEDIEHADLDALRGRDYGVPARYLKRPRQR
jgi:hypothetical protein